MRIPSQLGYVLGGAATLALLAGCSGGGAGTPAVGSVAQSSIRTAPVMSMSVSHQPVVGHSVLRPDVQPLHLSNPAEGFVGDDVDATGPIIAVSDAADNVVNVYSAAGKQTAQLTGFSEPQGLAIDSKGSLYVADTANSAVKVYAKGFKGSPKVLTDSGQYPAGVAVSTKGEIGVTNIISTSGGPGSVSFFSAAGKLIKTVPGGAFGRVYFDGYDAKGNLFVDGEDASGNIIEGELVGGSKAKAIAKITISNSLSFPGGVQVTSKDAVAIGDQSAAAVFTYAGPTKGKLTLKTTTPLTGASDDVTFAFTSTDKDLYTADAGLAESLEYAYPKGGAALHTINVGGQPIGVAVSPDEKP